MNEITVLVNTTWDECSHAGCSGPETMTITVSRGDKTITVSDGSCYGYSIEDLIAKAITEWEKVHETSD